MTQIPDQPSWKEASKRIQLAMWVDDGAKCSCCGYEYKDVDDFLSRGVRCGKNFGHYGANNSEYLVDWFVDDLCRDKRLALRNEIAKIVGQAKVAEVVGHSINELAFADAILAIPELARCVSSHDALVEVLGELISDCDVARGRFNPPSNRAMSRARAVLAEAKELVVEVRSRKEVGHVQA